MIPASTCLIALLLLAPSVSTEDTRQYDDADYRDTIRRTEAALIDLNTDPERGLAALEAALERLQEHAPSLANDPQALELRTMAEFAIARAQLASGDRYAAAATVDSSLEALGDKPLDTQRLGPRLGGLVEERARLLAARGQARLRVECAQPCRVLVDERNLGDVSMPGGARELALPLGTHRIWIEALTPAEAQAPMRTQLELDSADTTTTLHFPQAGAAVPAPALPESALDDDALELPPRAKRRSAPRWLEISSIAVGVAALAAGAALWAIDSSCPGGADINDPLACPQLFDTRNAGVALLSAGLATGLAGGVMLVLDETRVGERRSRELGLAWTARF